MLLSEIKLNEQNPRTISDAKFKKLKDSIKRFPKMLALRPIVVDADGVVLGGNMRLRALQALGYEEVPDEWVRVADNLTDEEREWFVVEDNVEFGEWDFDMLANEYDLDVLKDLGVDIPSMSDAEGEQDNIEEITIPQYIVEVVCGDAEKQKEVFDLMDAQGYEVRYKFK